MICPNILYGVFTYISPPTPLKFNIAPEKLWLEDYFPTGKVHFQGLLLLNFRGVILRSYPSWSKKLSSARYPKPVVPWPLFINDKIQNFPEITEKMAEFQPLSPPERLPRLKSCHEGCLGQRTYEVHRVSMWILGWGCGSWDGDVDPGMDLLK